MKRFLIVLSVVFLAMAHMGAAAFAQQNDPARQTFEGSAKGFHGSVNVSVELDSKKKIKSVLVGKDHHETKGIGSVAIEKVSAAIVDRQTLKVDAVTGATKTGRAIIKATAEALKKAGINPAVLGYVEQVRKVPEKIRFNPAAMPEKAAVTGSITVKDVKGRTVKIDLPVSTYAISTMDVIDYVIPLLGENAFNKLVASGQDGGGGIQRYGRLYVPVVGNYLEHFGQISEHNAPFDLEMILATNPDVLIVNSAMGAHRHAMAIEPQLTEAGIPIVMIDVPGKSIASSAQDTIRLLGKIFQKEDRAEEVASFLDAQYELIASKNLAEQEDKPSVYYEKSGYSEVFGSTQTSKATGWGALVAVAGGKNIADDLLTGKVKKGRGTLDPEFLLQADPDFIITSGSGAGWMDNFPDHPAKGPSFDIVNRTGWDSLKAVKNAHVYEIAHAMNRSIYSFYACLKMSSLFYPDLFADVDPDARMDEFFKRFMLVDSSITGWLYQYGK